MMKFWTLVLGVTIPALLTVMLSAIVSTANADSNIATITVGTGPYGAVFNPDNAYIYTANVAAGSVSVIDGSTNKVIATITEPAGQTPRELAFNSDNGYIYVADVYSNTVSIIDGKTNKLLTSIPTGGSIVDGVAYDSINGNIYAVNAGSGTVSVIDGSTNKVIDTIKVGANPLEDEFNPDNGYIYVANEGSASVSVIDGSTNKVVDTISGVRDPVQLVYNPSNHFMYVAGHNSHTVSVIDTRTDKLVDTLTGFEDPTGVGYNSDTGNIYVGNQGSNYVSVLSGSTNKVIETITVGRGPVTPVFDPNNGNVYVTNFGTNIDPNNTVSVIATTTPTQPPTKTTITSATDGNGNPVQDGGSTVSTAITFQVTATPGTKPIAGFECSLDGGTFSSCATGNPATIKFKDLEAGHKHTFEVRAVDTQGNKDPNPDTFSWSVLTPKQAVLNLIDTIDSTHLPRGTTTSLEASLNNAIRQLDRNNDVAACNSLKAFLNQVDQKEINGQLTPKQAADLRQQATAIRDALGCSSTSTSSSLPSDISSPISQNHSDMTRSNNNNIPSTLSLSP